jgi:hypothetical protein
MISLKLDSPLKFTSMQNWSPLKTPLGRGGSNPQIVRQSSMN